MSDDPFALLEDTARRLDLEERGMQAVKTARTKILLGRDARSAFFTVLVLSLEDRPDWTIPTLATDGKVLAYNPAYVCGLTLPELMGCCMHEGLHCGKGDHARLLDADPALRQIVLDLSLNPMLLEAGFTLPAGALVPGRAVPSSQWGSLPPGVGQKIGSLPPGLLAEEYYQLLQEARPPQPPKPPPGEGEDEDEEGDQPSDAPGEGEEGDGEGGGTGVPDPGGCGAVRAAARDPAGIREAQELAKVRLYQAEEAARSRGALSAGLARLVEQTRQPVVVWRDVLREFVTRQAKSDYSWVPPNRRFVHQGLYLPSCRSETLGRVVVSVDTSGSIGEDMLSTFAGELEGIVSSFPDVQLTILYHDCEVLKVQEWAPQDGPLKLEPVGGGGTSHVPVFAWLEEHQDEHDEPPSCLVALTDLYTAFPDQAPDLPVLWAVVGNAGAEAPFGQVLSIDG